MAQVLLMRSSEGKVLAAPTWDKRSRPAAMAGPLDTGVPSRALERILHCWTKHALAEGSSEPLAAWDADFARRLLQDGLTEEVAAAVRQLRRDAYLAKMLPEFGSPAAQSHPPPPATYFRADVAFVARSDLAVAWSAAAGADPAAAIGAAHTDPVRAWCFAHAHVGPPPPPREEPAEEDKPAAAHHHRQISASGVPAAAAKIAVESTALHIPDGARSFGRPLAAPAPPVWPDQAAASRARGRQRAEEDSTRDHRKTRACAAGAPAAPAASTVVKILTDSKRCLPVPVIKVTPAAASAPSLRSRRGLPELSCNCKCPQPLQLRAGPKMLPS